MRKLRIYFWLFIVSISAQAQPSVGLINTEISGPLGVGKRLMQFMDSSRKDSCSLLYKELTLKYNCLNRSTKNRNKKEHVKPGLSFSDYLYLQSFTNTPSRK